MSDTESLLSRVCAAASTDRLRGVRAFAMLPVFLMVTGLVTSSHAADIPGELVVTHGVTPAGASTAAIPIPIIPGAGGLEPKLTLSYSSQDANSGYGLGWSLNGYSTIVRGTKTRFVDGAPGPIQYSADDAFYVSGWRRHLLVQLNK